MTKKQNVADIVIERLIKKIQEEKRMPWHKPFQSACMNWFSNREYMGINKLLLDGGEYITPNQIKSYNESKKTNFWFESGTPSEIVVFYSKIEKKISDKEAQNILKQPNGFRIVRPTQDGWVRTTWLLRYYRVYNIRYIRNITNETLKEKPEFKDGIYKKREITTKKGIKKLLELDGSGNPILKEGVIESDFEKLVPKLGDTIIEEHTPADQIVSKYISETGVGLRESGSGAYYTESTDSVYLQKKGTFKSTEAYYRVLFHELIHSTGIEKRLNRACFKLYHEGRKERSKEELVAEIGGLLLASEAGFREDTEWADNSLEYVAGWCEWMKDNKNEVLNGMLMAEKAKNYILSGGLDTGGSSDRSIDNPKEEQETDMVEEIADEVENTTSNDSDTDKDSTKNPKITKNKSEVASIKSKKGAVEFYNNNLSKYFNPSLTDEEKKEILDSVKGVELQHLYYLVTKEKLTKGKKKNDILILLQKSIEGLTRIG